MSTPVHTPLVWRFGVFEVDAQREELRRAGVPQRLRDQSFRILHELLTHAGELVTREDLRKALWPADTYVDFDHSLNSAVMRLREALDDTADKPLYIETIPKRGYRFVAPLALVADPALRARGDSEIADNRATLESLALVPGSPERKSFGSRLGHWSSLALIPLLMLLGAIVWYLRRPLPPPYIGEYVQLTNDGVFKTIAGTDGINLYLNLEKPAGHATVPVWGGRLQDLRFDLPTTTPEYPFENPSLAGVSPDGTAILVGSNFDSSRGWELWAVSTRGSASRYLAQGYYATWSPDSKTVLYSPMKGELFTLPGEGGESTLLMGSAALRSPAGPLEFLAWSPDGSKIRFVHRQRYWEVSGKGINPHEVLPGWHAANPRYSMLLGHWTPDGDFFLFAAHDSARAVSETCQIWALDERHKAFHRPNPEPIQLTNGATYWGAGGLAISKDGGKVYATGVNMRGELRLMHAFGSRESSPYLGAISAEFVDFSKDGRYIVYVTYPDGVMWRAERDGGALVQLTSPPLYPVLPRWSPDGTQILFFAKSASGIEAIYTMPSLGGTPKRLLPNDGDQQTDPNWSTDGKKIVFDQTVKGERRLRIRKRRMRVGIA